jgi:pimeloyl-ACP methyl ester carboxylesterase
MSQPAVPRETMIPGAEGIRLHVVEWGAPTGWPVVILHGGAHSASIWEGVCRLLPPELRAIVPDQRGHGDSDWSPSGNYACAAQVEDLEHLLQALQIERCALVGHSMGGLNALLYAGTHPGRTAGLVLVDVGTESRRAGLERTQRARRQPERVHSRRPFDTRLVKFVPTYGGDTQERRRLLTAADTPLLIMRGEHSRILTRESAATTARLGNGTTVEIPDAGHNVAVDNPQAVAKALAGFLGPLSAT